MAGLWATRGFSNHPQRWLTPREGFSSLHPLLIQGEELSERILYRSAALSTEMETKLMPLRSNFVIRRIDGSIARLGRRAVL
jgi:hypothetical protein